jgi:hypothetical protein
MTYAAGTTVPVEKTKAEIEATLRRYGASAFMHGWDGDRVMLQFRAQDRYIRFLLTMPSPRDKLFTHHSRGPRSPAEAAKAWEQACRQKWRALALVIKAKLEAVSAGITSFEDEFLANIVLPDGQSVGGFMRPQIASAYEAGTMPAMLPMIEGPR